MGKSYEDKAKEAAEKARDSLSDKDNPDWEKLRREVEGR